MPRRSIPPRFRAVAEAKLRCADSLRPSFPLAFRRFRSIVDHGLSPLPLIQLADRYGGINRTRPIRTPVAAA
jgi:hypothetical protein